MIYIVAKDRDAAENYAINHGIPVFVYVSTPYMLRDAVGRVIFSTNWHVGRPQEEVLAFVEASARDEREFTPNTLQPQNLSVPWAVPRGRDHGEETGADCDEQTGRARIPERLRAAGQGPVVPRGKAEVRKVWDRVKRAWEALR